MKIKYRYNHLHAEEYLLVRKQKCLEEIEDCIKNIDANQYLKVSCEKGKLGLIRYDQKALNKEIKKELNSKGWKASDRSRSYYVTSDLEITKEIVKMTDANAQKKKIEERIDKEKETGPFESSNEVDFLKEKIAVEVQFGKYFSVAYDLHVKHTFFYIRDEIEVGIEIIPTHEMMQRMDSGVPWYENEMTNVVREGRNNPAVPVYILGIEDEETISMDPCDYEDSALKDILNRSDISKLRAQINKVKPEEKKKSNPSKKLKRINRIEPLLDECDGGKL